MKESNEKRYLNHMEHIEEIESRLRRERWWKISMGASYGINYNGRFNLYFRVTDLKELLTDSEQKKLPHFSNVAEGGPVKGPENADIIKVSEDTMGSPKKYMTPVIDNESELPVLSGFGELPSLRAIRSPNRSVIIAFDSEWYYEAEDPETQEVLENQEDVETQENPETQECSDNPENRKKRQTLTWQFATIYNGRLLEFVFLRKMYEYELSLELALGRILDTLKLPCYDVSTILKYYSLGDISPFTGKPIENKYDTYKEAFDKSKIPYENGKKVRIARDWSTTEHLSVTLLCHAGKVDISTLDQSGKYQKNVLKYCSEVQGGLVTLQPFYIYPNSVNPAFTEQNHGGVYPVSLQIADTMCHAPAGMKSLKTLGEAVGWPKVELEESVIEKMDELLVKDSATYFRYASNDSVVTLLYAAALYGYNHMIPVTITSITSKVMRKSMMSYLGIEREKDFDRKYRGLQIVGRGKVPRKNRPGYIENKSIDPISDKANTIQYYASQAYHGGYNSCSDVGYYPFDTFDYDLQNAYPTAMCLVSDIDWENPIQNEIINRNLTLQDFMIPFVGGYNPIPMMVAYIRFEFPENVKYPCIPISVDGIPVYPRTSDGIDGVYACGPEIYLALQLGAEIYCERGFFLNSIVNEKTGKISYSLRAAVEQLVKDRNVAKDIYGKKSLEELILKTMVNSGYGKNAQNVIQKNTWTAKSDEMVDLGASSITNPVSACMITSIIRATLIAAQNQCHEMGYMTCSVTTDGFISDIPENTLQSLDLMGIQRFMSEARIFLSGNPALWEIKHYQDDLLNFTTRENVSLHEHGVCAHNSTKSGYPSDSYEDRLWLMKSVASRTGTVDYTTKAWTTFKDIVQGKMFEVIEITRHVRMDFDMKRKPDRESFVEKEIILPDETRYKIANFSTIPFENIKEFKVYRAKKDTIECLKTMEEWELFWFKIDSKGKMRTKDKEWAILFSCIIGHRAGFWKIPKLDKLAGKKRCDFINSHNTSKRKFKINDWKNAGRNERQASMLPRELLEEKLEELMEN